MSQDWRESYVVTPILGSGVGDPDNLNRMLQHFRRIDQPMPERRRRQWQKLMDDIAAQIPWPTHPGLLGAQAFWTRAAAESVRTWARAH